MVWAVARVEEVKEVVRSLCPLHGGWVVVATKGGQWWFLFLKGARGVAAMETAVD